MVGGAPIHQTDCFEVKFMRFISTRADPALALEKGWTFNHLCVQVGTEHCDVWMAVLHKRLAVNLPVSAQHQLPLLVNHQVLIPTSAFAATFCWVAGLEIFSNLELVCCLERYFKDIPSRLEQYEHWVRNGVLKFYSNSICNTFFTSNCSLLAWALSYWPHLNCSLEGGWC